MSLGEPSSAGDTIVIVTGSSRGNGAGIATGLARHGFEVVGVDREISDSGIFTILGDVTDPSTISKAIERVAHSGKRLVLVNNAGITLPHVGAYPKTSWDATLNVNLTAPYLWIEAVLPLMKAQRWGSLIHITSLAAETGFDSNPAYAAAKGGLRSLSKAYARSLGPFGIRSNCVGPGYIETEMTRRSFTDPVRKSAITRHTVLGRWGRPEDLVGIVCLLATDAASYITGQDVYVDGGWLTNGFLEY